MHCGQMLAQPASAAPGDFGGSSVAVPAPSRSKTWMYALVAGVALLALLGGLMATGVLRFGAQQRPGDALAARGAGGGNSLPATGDTGPNTLPATGDRGPNSLGVTGQAQPTLPATAEKVVMPDDIRRWLEHLERIEKRRMAMAGNQVGMAMEMLIALQAGGTLPMLNGLLEEAMTGETQNTPGPIKDTMDTSEKIREGWRELNADFNSFPPPAECIPIRNEYDVALRETGAMIGDILNAVTRAEEDREGALSTLMKMRGNSQHIDRAAVETDDKVQRICDKYDTRKWFRISADIGGGALRRGGF